MSHNIYSINHGVFYCRYIYILVIIYTIGDDISYQKRYSTVSNILRQRYILFNTDVLCQHWYIYVVFAMIYSIDNDIFDWQ